MPIQSPRVLIGGLFAPALAIGLVACVSVPPVEAERNAFDGKWSVRWCDETAPQADCGGFHLDLVQQGDRIEGESFGARIRLSQIDEGGTIHGIVVGRTAVMTIESARSGAIYLAEAHVRGDCMRWKIRETVRRADRDIDIVAFDDVLTRTQAGLLPAGHRAGEECRDERGKG